MSQNYTIKDVKKGSTTKNSYGEYQNYALAIAEHGEPVKLVRLVGSEEPKAGDVIFGSLREFEANDRTYYQLQPESKPEQPPMTTQEAIMSQWAIGRAIDIWIAQGCQEEAYANIQTEAQHFYTMIPNIREEQ